MLETLTFYVLGAFTLLAALGVIFHPNNVMGALHYFAVLVGILGLSFAMHTSNFAVGVLFVYSVCSLSIYVFISSWLFLQSDKATMFSAGSFGNLVKVLFSGMLAGIFLSSLLFEVSRFGYLVSETESSQFSMINILKKMSTNYGILVVVLVLTLFISLFFVMRELKRDEDLRV